MALVVAGSNPAGHRSKANNVHVVIERIRRQALPIAIWSLVIQAVMTVVSLGLWWVATIEGWVESVTFVSHVSMLALVFAGVSGVASGLAGILAVVPTDDVLDSE